MIKIDSCFYLYRRTLYDIIPNYQAIFDVPVVIAYVEWFTTFTRADERYEQK